MDVITYQIKTSKPYGREGKNKGRERDWKLCSVSNSVSAF